MSWKWEIFSFTYKPKWEDVKFFLSKIYVFVCLFVCLFSSSTFSMCLFFAPHHLFKLLIFFLLELLPFHFCPNMFIFIIPIFKNKNYIHTNTLYLNIFINKMHGAVCMYVCRELRKTKDIHWYLWLFLKWFFFL